MARITSLLIGTGLVALQACSSGVGTEDVGVSQSPLTCSDTPRPSETCANAKAWGFCGTDWFAGNCQITCGQCSAGSTGGASSNGGGSSAGGVSISYTSDSGTSYCVNVSVTNKLSTAAGNWVAIMDLQGSTMTSNWGASFASASGRITAKPTNTNTSIAPGSSASFGFCANAPNASARPVMKAWNFESNVYQACESNNGNWPTLAALAVAMGTELGRWDPLNDLSIVYVGSDRAIALSSTGQARCTNGCKNTKALLGQQGVPSSLTGGLVDGANYRATAVAGIDRQSNMIADYKRNSPSKLPPAHKLTRVNVDPFAVPGACGPHYLFQVDNADGTPMTSAQAANMANALCFVGNAGCGVNAYIGFFQTANGCPAGRTCVAIDPTDGDNGTGSSTSAGSAPTYPLNRVYDPDGALLGTACITTKGVLASLQSKCALYSSTCGYDYCM
jgi:hypothetical protein